VNFGDSKSKNTFGRERKSENCETNVSLEEKEKNFTEKRGQPAERRLFMKDDVALHEGQKRAYDSRPCDEESNAKQKSMRQTTLKDY